MLPGRADLKLEKTVSFYLLYQRSEFYSFRSGADYYEDLFKLRGFSL